MRKKRTNLTDILDQYVSGYHEYALDEPVHILHASESLCRLLGLTEKDFSDSSMNMLLPAIHPADGNRFKVFLRGMAENEKAGAFACRIITQAGETLHVSISVKSVRGKDGSMTGYASLTEMTDPAGIARDAEQMSNLQFMNDTIPCGLLRYSCEKLPKVTYVNDTMLDIMRIRKKDSDGLDPVELYKSNIYLMIADESRERFAKILQKVYLHGKPHAGEISVVRGDGSHGRLFGWITKFRGQDGREEFQSICMDVTHRYRKKKSEQTKSYLSALSFVYDMIFEIDTTARTACYLQGKVPFFDEYLKGVPMDFDTAVERWLNSGVMEGDRLAIKRFLLSYVLRGRKHENGPPEIDFSFREGGRYHRYHAILLKTDPSRVWFCCSEIPGHAGLKSKEQHAVHGKPGTGFTETEHYDLENENHALKTENRQMKQLMQRFTEGGAAFAVKGDRVTPLYVSDNAYAFFGYSEEEWARLMRESPTTREFVSKTGIPFEKFEELLRKGKADFVYRDVASGKSRQIRAVCSYPEEGERFYIMLYNRPDGSADVPHVRIRTFGYFDVFVDGRPIMFRYEKAKELLALLVDRRGGYVSSEEAISFLWEDEPASPVVLARYRKVSMRLKNLLEEYGISEIIESVSGQRRLVTELVECDLYQYLSGEPEYTGLFNGSYLTNYSWGETTLGELLGFE